MKTPDEIKKGLKLCYEDIDCSECPYLDECFGDDEKPFSAVMPDALDYIQQLEATNAELLTKVKHLEAKCHQLERERDAAVEDMACNVECRCDVCKHRLKDSRIEPCNNCSEIRRGEENHFEWRGVKEE